MNKIASNLQDWEYRFVLLLGGTKLRLPNTDHAFLVEATPILSESNKADSFKLTKSILLFWNREPQSYGYSEILLFESLLPMPSRCRGANIECLKGGSSICARPLTANCAYKRVSSCDELSSISAGSEPTFWRFVCRWASQLFCLA